MKLIKRLVLIFFSLVLLASICLMGCTDTDNGDGDYVKITFVQEGEKDVIKYVKRGESLLDVPHPVAKEGYDIEWSESDFLHLSKSKTITAVKTPKDYTITYNLGDRQGDAFAQIHAYTQTVKYNQMVTTYKPKCSGYIFVSWEVKDKNVEFSDGKYLYLEDITLIAVWEINKDDDDRFSPIVPSS